ncbi:MAG: glucose-6-phosphate isomerase, partial [Verrucomicrobiaceae bacterium]
MSWQSYNQSIVRYPQHGFSLDLSLMDIEPALASSLQPKIAKAFSDMQALEAGEVVNPDEGRMV